MDGSMTGAQQALFAENTNCYCHADDQVFDPRSVIQQFNELPEGVREAKIARIDGRLLDKSLFTQLISQSPPPNSEIGWSTRIHKREESLFPYLGRVLFCVLIRLPGVQYTVEVDPATKAVVYWEWQPI